MTLVFFFNFPTSPSQSVNLISCVPSEINKYCFDLPSSSCTGSSMCKTLASIVTVEYSVISFMVGSFTTELLVGMSNVSSAFFTVVTELSFTSRSSFFREC